MHYADIAVLHYRVKFLHIFMHVDIVTVNTPQ